MSLDSLSLLKSGLKTSLAQGLYNEIVSNTSGYYYFIGKTLEWMPSVDNPLVPLNTQAYESETREKIIFLKKITSADISFTVPRYDWIENHVYDMYDDQLGKEVIVDVDTAGANTLVLNGTFNLQDYGIGWLVEGEGIATSTFISSLTPSTLTLSKSTTGTVTTIKVVNTAVSGAKSLETAKFYVLTNERNVYKCIQNNQGAPSTVKPFTTTHESIATPDGYIWKFMYTIPGSLQNKFTSLDDMPVTTSLKAPFYSQGAISSVTVQNYGSGYQQGDFIVVTGDGYLKENIYRVVSVIIENAGSGYTTLPTITVDDPFDTVDFEPETEYSLGQYVKVESRIYEVRQGGSTGLAAPTHTSTVSVSNGTTAMRFVGLAVSGVTQIENGSISSTQLSGIIGYINVTNVGGGYDPENPPAVTITGDGEGAAAVANITAQGYISSITISNRGTGYTTATALIEEPEDGIRAEAAVEIYYGFGYSVIPAVSVSEPFEADIQWEANSIASEDDIVQVGTRFYRVTSEGATQQLGASIPTHFAGTEVNGECDLLFIGETASLSMLTEKTKAVMTPVIQDGQVTNVVVQNGGAGYTIANIDVLGSGTGAIITPNISQGDANTRQANSELLAVPGSIDAIDVLNPGLGYVTATVTVQGDGSGCEAEAVIEEGIISKIIVTAPGSGYTKATVTISGNEEATQAYARPIISPYGGHGKNAVVELFAKDIALSTSIAKDRNQGFIVENDYRQLGIIRNPEEFFTTQRFNGFSGSTCFVIGGNFLYNEVDEDVDIADADGNVYRIVAKPTEEPSAGQPLSLLVQSIDNKIPVIGESVYYSNSREATIVKVTPPTVNKYSGDILFIDNRASFQPTDEQTLAIKTVIRL